MSIRPNTIAQAALGNASSAVRRLNPRLFAAQHALGLADDAVPDRGPLPPQVEPEPEPEQPQRGRTNEWSDGRQWEETILACSHLYEQANFLRVRKVSPASRIVGGGNDRKVIFMPNDFVDFVGSFTQRGGRAVFVEAKQTHEDRLPLGRGGGVTDKQVRTMRDWTLANAMTAVLWRSPSGVWIAPYREIAMRITEGRKALLPEHCRAVPCEGYVVLADGRTRVERPLWGEALAALYPRSAS